MDSLIYVFIVLIFFAVLVLLIWVAFIQINLNDIQVGGTNWTITYGSTDQMSDNAPGGGGQLFIAQTQLKSGYTVVVQADNSSAAGLNYWINNRSLYTITVNAANEVIIDNNSLGPTITPGATAQYVYADQNKLLRLQ